MKVLIDIGHPAHVHLFKNTANSLIKKGHSVLFTCRDKEFEIQLLKHSNFDYVSFGKKYNNILMKGWGLLEFDAKMLRISKKYKPDLFLSHGSMYAAHASFILKKPHIAFEDTFNKEQLIFSLPFTSSVLTGDYPHPELGKKEIRFSGYHELAYLHPNIFSPDKSILDEIGVSENEKFVILRFVSWKASHDIGHTGIFYENKLKAIKAFEKYAKVFISSEAPLPKEIEKYRINIEPHRMHDAIAFSSLLFGESSTMSEEAAMLGVPSVYLFNNSTIYTTHLEKDYQLMFNYSESEQDQQKAIEKGVALLESLGLKEEWQKRRDKMLSEKIDVTAFMVWFIENYPSSARIMKENPDYQYRFK